MDKQDIKDFTIEELETKFSQLGEPAFRARQAAEWLYQKGAADFDRMTNLPAGLREKLKEEFYVSRPEAVETYRSGDGTEKFLFRLADKSLVEAVLIPGRGRGTLCLSTQVGCRYGCVFCASGQDGFTRNLSLAEILNQLLFVRFERKREITNVVFMGMGEPFDNFENLARAIGVINHPKGLAIGARKITVSTCGIIPGIERFEDLGRQVELSISLHAADEALRSRLMPVNRKYPLAELTPILAGYTRRTGRKITLEYLLMKGINDSPEAADKLAEMARYLSAKVNLLGYSAVAAKPYRTPDPEGIIRFAERLAEKGVKATIRRSRGGDIAAACGQLAGKHVNKA